MSKQSERIHLAIVQLMEELQCDFWDACLEFCSRGEIDPVDLVKQMDAVTLERVKQCAIEQRMIRRCFIRDRSQELTFE